MLCWLQITLDVQLKSEQESIEGLPAIIASIEGQGQGMSSSILSPIYNLLYR